MPKEKNKTIKCEICTTVPSVIIHEKIYYCADCMLAKQGYRKGDKNNGSRKARSK